MIFDIVAALVIFYYVLPLCLSALLWVFVMLLEKPVATIGALVLVAVILRAVLG